MKHVVARASDIPVGHRLIVDINGHSVGIFNVDDQLYAVLNRCPHQGAALCKGSVLGRLEADGPGEIRYDDSAPLLQCPWHGWEYDLRDGRSYFDSRVRAYGVGVEPGSEVIEECAAGVVRDDHAAAAAELHAGLSGTSLVPGPFVAETYEVTVEGDYVVVDLAPERRAAQTASGKEEA